MSVLARSRTLGDVLRGQAAERAQKVALESVDGRTVTFGAFDDRVNRLCHALGNLGVRHGARVAILAKNRIEYVECYGLAKAGLIVVPLNWRLAASELSRLIAHSAPEVLIVDEAHRVLVETMRDELPGVRHVVALDGGPAPWLDYETLIAEADPAEPTTDVSADDVLCLIYTSGTTGAPKGVAITHAAALGNCRTAAAEMLGLDDGDVTMSVMPLFHVGGMWYHLFPSFATGCTTVVMPEFEPVAVLRKLASRGITNVHLVPTMIGALVARPEAATAKLDRLRLIFYAASSMPVELLRRAMRTFPRCGFSQGYGSTESGVVTALGSEEHRRALDPLRDSVLSSCGRALPGRRVRLTGDDGAEVKQGEVGEIEVSSADVMQGYWRDDGATQAARHDGWLRTGDLGRVDEEGYLFVVDRKHDMVVTGGENVYPNEVEACLYRDPDVLEAAVFGIPDPRWVERVAAAVILRPGSQLSAAELTTRLRRELATYKCPKDIFFTSTLPKSAVGKVLRKELRKQYGSVAVKEPS